jgi:hypothetical protein
MVAFPQIHRSTPGAMTSTTYAPMATATLNPAQANEANVTIVMNPRTQ